MSYESRDWFNCFPVRHAPHLWIVLAIIACCLTTPVASAVESDQKFAVHKADGSLFGTYATQQQAELAIRTIPGSSEAPDAYQYVREIKEPAKTTEDGKTTITYWMGRHDRTLSYVGLNGRTYETEEDFVSGTIAIMNASNSPPCPSATMNSVDEWVPYQNLVAESRNYHTSGYTNYEGCDFWEGVSTFFRYSICAIPYTRWDFDEKACMNKEILAYIKTDGFYPVSTDVWVKSLKA